MTMRVTPLTLLPVALAASVLAGATTVLWPGLWLLAAGALGFGALLALSGAWRSFELAVALVSAFAGILISTHVGPISAFGALTIALAGALALLWLARPEHAVPCRLGVLPLLALTGWGFVSMFARYHPTVPGVQNLLAIGVFAGIAALTARQARGQADYVARLDRVLTWSALSGTALFLVGYALPSYGPGFGVGPRGYAIFASVLLGWFLARWRYGSRAGLLVAVLLIAVIALSLSRTALAVSLLLCALAQFRPRQAADWLRLGGVSALVGLAAYIGVTRVPAVRARFFEGDLAISVGGVPINAMGRTKFWSATWASFRQSPWLGKGPGSVQELIMARFPGNEQPHQDYLRILHDYGLLGLTLWIVGCLALLWWTWRAWQRAPESDGLAAVPHLAGFLGLMAVALIMLTDNVMIYVFAMAPLGVIVGASLGGVPAELPASRAAPAPTSSLARQPQPPRLHPALIPQPR